MKQKQRQKQNASQYKLQKNAPLNSSSVALHIVKEPEDEWTITKPTHKEMGLVQLTLDKGVKTTAIGTIYGLDFEVEGKGFTFRVFFDYYNRRLKLIDYEATNYKTMVTRLTYLGKENNFDKIFIKAKKNDWQRFLELGFMLEGIIKYFYNGEDAYVLSKFDSVNRITSNELIEKSHIIEKIMQQSKASKPAPLPSEYKIIAAQEKDIPALVKLYRQVFKTYPSPLTHPDFIQQTMRQNIIYRGIMNPQGVIVSAASADISPKHSNAELTDCATLKKERSRGFMHHLLESLEKDLKKKNIITSYTLSRAMSRSINQVFYSLDYEYSGRLINNCDIYGKFEDMNIWVKNLNT